MNALANKIASVLPALEKLGTVYLFALAEREDINLWDIVLSSDWADQNWPGAIGTVVDLLWPILEPQERTTIARVAVVPSSDPRVQEMPDSLNGVTPEDEKVVYVSLLGSDIRRAFVFRAQHAPTARPTPPEVVAAHA